MVLIEKLSLLNHLSLCDHHWMFIDTHLLLLSKPSMDLGHAIVIAGP